MGLAAAASLEGFPYRGSRSEERAEEEELAIHGTTPTSTSNTMVLSEEHRTAAETLPPPQQNTEASAPVPSPRAPLPKKAKIGAGSTQVIVTGSSSTPLMDDPIMKDLISLGSQFIGFRDEAESLRALRRAEERADALEAKLKSSETASKKAEKEAAAVEGRMGEEYTLHEKTEDHLLDTLSILELNGDLARTDISNARTAFKRLFPHFFPKETQPEIFSELVQRFLAKEDPALAHRQDILKIGVEGTIALVAASGQDVDWVKAGNPKGLNKEKWKALVTDDKPPSKKIIAYLNPKSTASASTARTELVFDNHTEAAEPSNASPAASHSARAPAGVLLDDSSCADSIHQELADLRQQLQAMKKQVVIVMGQSRKSSDREQAALQQAQEALKLKESAAAAALRATKSEDYMLDLMTDASQDMAGSFLDAVTEEQRVNARVELLLRLAKQNGTDFWEDEDRTRRIARFQD
ncbi:hypothetical protein QYE76_011173 [Lolium multiflorum]|uniref:Uncharacterized protein n=1 Tax=Lolium multiflorum TaxID=4521 RepID=A0AAD8TUW7_LOLMU|nr:hypothetical protein QYE76_011173 [Lolium multiflorum]